MRIKAVLVGFLLLIPAYVGGLQAPTPTPTPVVLGALTAITPTPRPPKPQDPRPAICSAPFQSGWEAHPVQVGDTLSALMRGQTDLSVTQVAALNCLDDPSKLPVGAVVWLPPLPDTALQLPTCPQLVTQDDTQDCVNPVSGIEGAQQLFQNGMMIWRADTQEIWVIVTGETVFQVFDDAYVEGEPDPAVSPPATFFGAKRGFGKVWAALGAENSALGWATAPESQISLTIQAAGRVSYTTYLQLPDGDIYAATVLPGTGQGWWVPVTVAAP